MEHYKVDGTIATAYDYTPYGTVTASGIDQPIQWSSEHYDPELALVYYNYRHYNPSDGRWINRDPIMEQGGYNVYGFVDNRIMDRFDQLGRKFVPIIQHKPYQDILKFSLGCVAYTGAVSKAEMPQPELDIIKEWKRGDLCCAQIVSARNIDLFVLTLIPNNGIGEFFTQDGWVAVCDHEKRRRLAYKMAYDYYLANVQGKRPFVRRCRTICRKQPGQAKKELIAYLDKLRHNAFREYDKWVGEQQDEISKENYHDETNAQNLMTRHTYIAKISTTYYPIELPSCPSTNES